MHMTTSPELRNDIINEEYVTLTLSVVIMTNSSFLAVILDMVLARQ